MHKSEKECAPHNMENIALFGQKRLQRAAEKHFLVNSGQQHRRYHKNGIIPVCKRRSVPRNIHADNAVKPVGKSVQHKAAECEHEKTAENGARIAEAKKLHPEKLFAGGGGRKLFQQKRGACKQKNSDNAYNDFPVRKVKKTENRQHGAHYQGKNAGKYSLFHFAPYLSLNSPSSVMRISTRTSNLPRGSFFSILSA